MTRTAKKLIHFNLVMSLKNSNKFRLGRHLFYYLTTWIWAFGEEDREAYKTYP